MTVNTADVTALLLRLQADIQPAATKGAMTESKTSFALNFEKQLEIVGNQKNIASQSDVLNPETPVPAMQTLSSVEESKTCELVQMMKEVGPESAVKDGVAADAKSLALVQVIKHAPTSKFLGETVLSVDKSTKPLPAKVKSDKSSLDLKKSVPVRDASQVSDSQLAAAAIPQTSLLSPPGVQDKAASPEIGKDDGVRTVSKAQASIARQRAAIDPKAVARQETSVSDQSTAVHDNKATKDLAGAKLGKGRSIGAEPHPSPLVESSITSVVTRSAGIVVASQEQAETSTKLGLSSRQNPQSATIGADKLDSSPYDLDRSTKASSSSLEVGVSNGMHGWLKVRAELTDSGTVTAALSPSTPAAEQMLHRELPSLSSFLHEEQLPVSSLVIHQSQQSSGFLSGSDAGSANAQTGSRGSTSQQQQQGIGQELAESYDSLPPIQTLDLLDVARGWVSIRA